MPINPLKSYSLDKQALSVIISSTIMKLVKWKYVVLVIVPFLLGVGATYFYMTSLLEKNKTITRRIIDNCATSMSASQTLINSCSAAYDEVSSCVLNLNTCNMENSKKKLQKLNEQKNDTASKLENATKDLTNIVHDVTG